ncbi:MAG: methyltransferase domain-containing protein [Chloroflexi bacterium]|nr:methyltransferase domain-containing protein [Chloroflexota bacterium]
MTSEIFKGTAWYYARYREPYPPALFELLRAGFRLDGRGRLLDVGTGTGHLAIPFHRDFEEIVAIDVSAEMIDEARGASAAAGAKNIDFRVMSGDAISTAMGRFRLVSFGQSLHWMDPDQTLRVVHQLITPGGGVAIPGSRSIWGGSASWEVAVVEVVKRWLGDVRRAGAGTFRIPVRPFEESMADAGFGRIESHKFPMKSVWDIPYILGHLYSTSYCGKELLADRVSGFEADLKKTLLAIEPSGRFAWNVDVQCLIGHVS